MDRVGPQRHRSEKIITEVYILIKQTCHPIFYAIALPSSVKFFPQRPALTHIRSHMFTQSEGVSVSSSSS